ncbi:MAG: hypothetical protein JWN44_5152 [Myxococcales bacterium]|nr:hypothetical protein [Myxococcales bacterium]
MAPDRSLSWPRSLSSLRLLALAALLSLLPLVAGGCRGAADDYTDFLERRQSAGADPEVQSTLQDLSGRWMLHALLAGGLDLGLRVELRMDLASRPMTVHARMWLAASNPDVDAPVADTDSPVASDGTFVLHAEPLVLAAGSTPGLNSAVRANVVLLAATQSTSDWCGTAIGTVEQPLMLDLAGSTFAARRDDARVLAVSDVPLSCFPHGSGDGGLVETPRPMSPDLSSVSSAAADLTGNWILDANLAQSLPLRLWASLVYVPSADGGGSLDGALRRAIDPPGSVALTTFSTPVTPDGRFELWLPALAIGTTQASVLLVGATRSADVFCGAGAGRVHKPIDLDLMGTTFGAVRWTPGTALPAGVPDRCQ